MQRNDFIKNTSLGLLGALLTPQYRYRLTDVKGIVA